MSRNTFKLLYLTIGFTGSLLATDVHSIYYERFKAAYIQAHEALINKIWNELKTLTIKERDLRITALMKQAHTRGDAGIQRIFSRVCSYCMEQTSQVKYDTYCKCTSKMCANCFQTLAQCPRCEDKLT